jgi:hypothetical protein
VPGHFSNIVSQPSNSIEEKAPANVMERETPVLARSVLEQIHLQTLCGMRIMGRLIGVSHEPIAFDEISYTSKKR